MGPYSRYRAQFENIRNNSNRVITRQVGEIPGCVPAVDVFIEMIEEQVLTELKANPYWKVWNDYRFGVIGWNEWLNHPIHKQPIRSFIKNPVTKSTGNRYNT